MIDYQVRLISFPPGSIKETVAENEDGSYTIFIEQALSHEEQRKEFLHAMSHILGNDFSKRDIQQIELQAHKGGNEYEKKRINRCFTGC